MIKAGKKTKEWDDIRKNELIPEFEAKGITTCEIRKQGVCWFNNALSFAHTKKRRNIILKNDPAEHYRLIRRVVLACNPCHDWVESLGEKKMEIYLEDIINKRGGEYIE